jgi:arylformamidase
LSLKSFVFNHSGFVFLNWGSIAGVNWIDISVPVRNGMVHWPGDPQFHIERATDQEKGDPATVSKMTLGVHTGTHMDAPLHFIPHARSIDQIPLDATVGPARVIAISNPKSIQRADLIPHSIAPGERILFRTLNSDRAWKTDQFQEDFVFISQDAARYLAERAIRAVGVDYLSVGGFRQDGPETHHALLAAGIWIIEGLNLSAVQPGNYELVCLPLKLIGSEGAPARAILRTN